MNRLNRETSKKGETLERNFKRGWSQKRNYVDTAGTLLIFVKIKGNDIKLAGVGIFFSKFKKYHSFFFQPRE